MTLEIIATGAVVLAALPALLVILNLPVYRTPRRTRETLPSLAILIPARNEERQIEATVRAALASTNVDIEVVVMDDQSSDRTASIVSRLAAGDRRLRLVQAPPLPSGWSGKQHACHLLAETTTAPLLLFIDADVELAPEAAGRAAACLIETGSDLASGFPRQITGSFVEKLVIPLIHFVLLGYLPLSVMRRSSSETFAAGCGQMLIVRRERYLAMGGHRAIRSSFHDGLKLPRAFRRAGLRTELFDATRLANCRMYSNGREVILGLAKNADEGMGGPIGIWVWSALLLWGHVVPGVMVAAMAAMGSASTPPGLLLTAAGLGIATRLVLAARFRQSLVGALLHPLGVAVLIGIQWYAWYRRRTGRAVPWKDRVAVGS